MQNDTQHRTWQADSMHTTRRPMSGKLPQAGDKKIVLKDITIRCALQDSPHPAFAGLVLATFGLAEGNAESTRLEQVSPATWKHNGIIELQSDMDELVFIARSETSGDLGCIWIAKDEIVALMAADDNMTLERDFVMENCPSLGMTFTLDVLSASNREVLGQILAHDLWAAGAQLLARRETPADAGPALSMANVAGSLTSEDNATLSLQLGEKGTFFMKRFERTGDLADNERAISYFERAVQLTREDDANLPVSLNNLGACLHTRSTHTGNLADVDRAISHFKRAIRLSGEGYHGMPSLLNNLGNALRFRSEHNSRVLADIKSAISHHQRAVQLTAESDPALLNNLANSFRVCFEYTGDLTDIDSSVSLLQKAIRLAPEGHPILLTLLNNLGNSFHCRFQHSGDITDIESSISNIQRSIRLAPQEHVDFPRRLVDLGSSFRVRFERTGDPVDIESAILNIQRAVELTPEGHADLPARLNSLGLSFQSRFDHTGDLTDNKNAILNLKRAVSLTPEGHSKLFVQLNSLGLSFEARFKHTKDPRAIACAINNFQMAVQLAPEGHFTVPLWINNLAGAFQSRFEYSGDLADIDNTISYLQRAVKLTPKSQVTNLAQQLRNLADAWRARFEHTQNPDDLNQTMSNYRSSASQISWNPSRHLFVAKAWALLARQFGHEDALEAFRVAVGLLSEVAGLEQTIHRRMDLIDKSNLTAAATATAIDAGQIETALAWLEQGRCLVWNQIKQLRTPVEELRTCNAPLADRFSRVANALEAAGSRQSVSEIFSNATMNAVIAAQSETEKHVKLAKEWAEILKKIRTLPGFYDFLRTPSPSDLLTGLSDDGVVITFSIHEARCDALALIPGADDPLHIPLEKFSYAQAVQRRDSLRAYLRSNGAREASSFDSRAGRRFQSKVEEAIIYQVLRELWEYVAKPILNALGYSVASPPERSHRTRMWWCPTGPLAFLPIHAAGIYSKDRLRDGPCISDFVVSSYTPTVSALLDKIKSTHARDQTSTSLLLISQPSTPGLPPIPLTKEETCRLRDMMTKESIKTLLLEDSAATTGHVTNEMKRYSWVHFACHAIQDQADPLKSGVHLHDGRLELFEMMKQQTPNANLAFLSACQTGTGDEALSDEVVHLAAGLLAAGYRGVVGTMWSIKDYYGPDIAEAFYQYLLDQTSEKGEGLWLDSASAAHALDESTRRIREKLGDTEDALLTWVPYVHFGV